VCLDCSVGCDPNDDHGDSDHITLDKLQAAADAHGITPLTAATNILANVAMVDAGQLPGGATDQAATKTEYAAMNVIKAQDEKRYTLGLAYPALVAPGKGADGFNDFISEEALEKAAWEWMANRREIGLFHQDGLDGQATVVESYIWRGPTWTIQSPVDGSTVAIKSGDWMLGTIWNKEGWELVKAGLVQGWSPEGGARRAKPSAERLAMLRR
jgi:Putative phage serine protease XkdF